MEVSAMFVIGTYCDFGLPLCVEDLKYMSKLDHGLRYKEIGLKNVGVKIVPI